MNIYRLVADMSHLFAILFLLFRICKTRSCAGISGKSQLLLLIVFLTRYLDLFTTFISYYNTFMKIIYIGSMMITVLLIFVVFKSTYDREHDTFPMTYLLLPVAGLTFYINYEFTFLEVLWTFSIYLEAVAILPQFYMIRKTGEMEMFTYHYLFALGLYRAFYIFNWVYRYTHEGYYDAYAFWAGCVQTALYCYFLYTKQFLKQQARAYSQLHAAEKGVDMEKGGEVMPIHAIGGEPENKVYLPVTQLDSITVSDLEENSRNTVTQQLEPSGNDTAQPQSHEDLDIAISKRDDEEDTEKSSVQLPQSLAQ